MWRTWQLRPIRSERKQGRHHQLIPWTILLFFAPFHLYPPPPPCRSFFTYRLPPSHETPCPSLSAHRWGAEKLLFRRTKYSSCWSQECKQQGTAEHNSNPPGFRVVSGNFLSPHNKQNTISRLSVLWWVLLFSIVHISLLTNLFQRLFWARSSRLVTKIESLLVAIHSPTSARTNLPRIIRNFLASEIEPSTDRDLGFYPHKYFHFIQIHWQEQIAA